MASMFSISSTVFKKASGRPSSATTKRPLDGEHEQPLPKRLKGSREELLQFHLNMVLDIVEDLNPEVREAVSLLTVSVDLFVEGATPDIVTFHLDRLKGLLPANERLSNAVNMLNGCIRHLKPQSK